MDSSSDKDIKQVIVIRKDLNMRKGKMCAQASHASNMFLFEIIHIDPDDIMKRAEMGKLLYDWIENGYKKVVVGIDDQEQLLQLIQTAKNSNIRAYPVTDFGLTEFHGQPTLTCASFGPCPSEEINAITGHLKLL